MSCLIVFKSVTYAQSAASLFSRNGINSYIIRPPVALGAGSCSFGLKIGENDCARAAAILRQSPIPIRGFFATLPNGDYRSVNI